MSFARASLVAISFLVAAATLAHAQTWDGGGANPSWTTAENWAGDLLPNLNNNSADVVLGTGFASGTTLTLDQDVLIDTLQFDAGSNGVNLVIAPGTGGFLRAENRGTGANAAIQFNSSSMHEISAQFRTSGNGGQEHRYEGNGGGTLLLSGGIDSDSKMYVNFTNNTVLHLTGTATGGARTDVNPGAIVRIDNDTNLFGGELRLGGGGGGGGPSNQGGILEITSASHNLNGKSIRMNGGGFAAVGADVTLNLTNIVNGGTIISGNQGGGPRFGSPNATHTVTVVNGIQRGNQQNWITSIDGPVDIEAILQGELGRGDRVNFGGTGTLQIEGKISSRDNIRVNGGTVILMPSAETARNNGNVENKTFELNAATPGFGADGDAALLLGGAQTRANNVVVRTVATGEASIGGWDGVNEWSGNVTLNGNANVHAEKASAETTFSGNISGNFEVTKTGLGTVIFSTNKGYTGATTVDAGTLRIGNAAALASSDFTVGDGGVLDNRGNLSAIPVVVQSGGLAMGDGQYGDITVNGGGAVNAGTSPGIMPSATLNINTAGIFQVEIDSLVGQPTAGAGAEWDFYDVTGDLTLPGGNSDAFVDLLMSSPALLDNDFMIQFAEAGNVLNFADTNFVVRDDMGAMIDGASVTLDNNGLFLNFVADSNNVVPEPTSVAAWALAGLIGLLVFHFGGRKI